MKKTLLLSAGFLAALALAACGGETASSSETSASSEGNASSEAATSEDVVFLTPTGSPSLAFYDQGDNENWTSTSDATSIPASFAAGTYDAIVFDGANGLNVIKKNGYNYKLARWISGGNFYVVSTKHEAGDAFEGNETIQAFNQTGNASLSFNKLATDYWKWDYEPSQVTYADGVQAVMQTLVSNDQAYDYYVIAEPVLTNAKTQLAAKGIELNTIYNLQTEWKEAGYGESIPAAALFFNVDSYASKKASLDVFLEETVERIDTAINDPAKVVETLEAYGSATEIQARFGYQTAQVTALQSNGENRFGLFGSDADLGGNASFANSFWTALGNEPFADSLFL